VIDATPEVERAFKDARHQPLLPARLTPGSGWGRDRMESVLPQRGSYLLLDAVIHRDERARLVVATRHIAAETLDGHFPGTPLWPGVQQVEAIAQAGALGLPADGSDAETERPMLTGILGAVFLRGVRPGTVTIASRWFDDGLFFIAVGQCLQADRICSVAAVKGLRGEVR